MTAAPKRLGRDYIARHGETIYNAAARFQEGQPHVPLTRAGFLQVDEMGRAMRDLLGAKPKLTIWCSTSERAVQTMAIIAGWLELDPFDAKLDRRLVEISTGSWGGKYYKDVVAEVGGPIVLADGVLKTPADGESYSDVARRVADWIAATNDDPGDRLVVSHGNTTRVLRALLAGLPPHPVAGAPLAPGLPQGSVSLVADGADTVAHRGTGHAPPT
jgi:probable phosphoglycerate mutase